MDELLRHADKAMYSVKEGGGAGYRFHLPRKDVDLRTRMRVDHAMRQALAAGPVPPALPAAGRPGQRPRGRRRGAAALARPGDGRDVARRVHPGRRGERLHRRHRRLGARRGGAPGGAMACARHAPGRRRQRVGAAVPQARLRRQRVAGAARVRPAAAVAGARTDRVDPDPGRPGSADAPGGAGAARRAAVDRRLRHRLLEPGLPEARADRAAQDRPQLRRRAAGRRERRRDRARDHRHGPRAAPAGHRRGRRDRGPAPVPAARRLRSVPGLPVRAGARRAELRAAGRHCAAARPRGRCAWSAPERCLALRRIAGPPRLGLRRVLARARAFVRKVRACRALGASGGPPLGARCRAIG